TTVFTITSESTLTTVLASKVRYGINPSISALAVVIVAITLFAAAVMEIKKRRTEAFEAAIAKAVIEGTDALSRIGRKSNRLIDPAFAMIILIFVAGIGTAYYAGTVGVEECKVAVLEARKAEIQRRIEERRQREMFQSTQQERQAAPATRPATGSEVRAPGTEGYQGMFAPGNLEGQVRGGGQGAAEGAAGQEPQAPTEPSGDSGGDSGGADAGPGDNQNIFTPVNLQNRVQGGANDGEPASGATGSTPAAGEGEGYQNIFAPSNLRNQIQSND